MAILPIELLTAGQSQNLRNYRIDNLESFSKTISDGINLGFGRYTVHPSGRLSRPTMLKAMLYVEEDRYIINSIMLNDKIILPKTTDIEILYSIWVATVNCETMWYNLSSEPQHRGNPRLGRSFGC